MDDLTIPLLLCVAPVFVSEIGALLRDERARKHDTDERLAALERRIEAIEAQSTVPTSKDLQLPALAFLAGVFLYFLIGTLLGCVTPKTLKAQAYRADELGSKAAARCEASPASCAQAELCAGKVLDLIGAVRAQLIRQAGAARYTSELVSPEVVRLGAEVEIACRELLK